MILSTFSLSVSDAIVIRQVQKIPTEKAMGDKYRVELLKVNNKGSWEMGSQSEA
jgi:hypothetical protein